MQLYLPTDNPLIYNYYDTTVELVEVMELCQGCPEVGYLLINSMAFNQDLRFGTNVLFTGYWLILPQFVSSWKTSGFKLCAIDLRTNTLYEISQIEPLAIPYKVEEKEVKYFIDLANQTSKTVVLP
ncbi:hypothetical protein [Spirosoma linguale]|uniref:Uncharacterized protein n=1 Tax=Spirosoma linguale (strain ATCC 33905 / DSM 74 / LMG 10896 / Claus 1) TaxID=504472 RepID=D2QC83_SPILD|nr:hypothetical protein Slin_0122 [Spirosoma linguale DSM 74]